MKAVGAIVETLRAVSADEWASNANAGLPPTPFPPLGSLKSRPSCFWRSAKLFGVGITPPGFTSWQNVLVIVSASSGKFV